MSAPPIAQLSKPPAPPRAPRDLDLDFGLGALPPLPNANPVRSLPPRAAGSATSLSPPRSCAASARAAPPAPSRRPPRIQARRTARAVVAARCARRRLQRDDGYLVIAALRRSAAVHRAGGGAGSARGPRRARHRACRARPPPRAEDDRSRQAPACRRHAAGAVPWRSCSAGRRGRDRRSAVPRTTRSWRQRAIGIDRAARPRVVRHRQRVCSDGDRCESVAAVVAARARSGRVRSEPGDLDARAVRAQLRRTHAGHRHAVDR